MMSLFIINRISLEKEIKQAEIEIDLNKAL